MISLEAGPRPLVMGVVNVTPDSFSDGGRYDTTERAVAHGRALLAEGADLLDIGGESTRPGATRPLVAEELDHALVAARRFRLDDVVSREDVVGVAVKYVSSFRLPGAIPEIAGDIAARIAAGERRIVGVMIESHLDEGRQDLVPGQPLRPGVSITDACISWAQTAPLLDDLARAVRARRKRGA